MQDPGALECRGHLEEMAKRDPMVDDRVIDIIKLLGLEGLYKTQSREIDHGLISALVERWRLSLSLCHSPLISSAARPHRWIILSLVTPLLIGLSLYIDHLSDPPSLRAQHLFEPRWVIHHLSLTVR